MFCKVFAYMGGLRGCPGGARVHVLVGLYAYIDELRGCPVGARVHVLVGLRLHGWIERVPSKCPGICFGRYLQLHGWIKRVSCR